MNKSSDLLTTLDGMIGNVTENQERVRDAQANLMETQIALTSYVIDQVMNGNLPADVLQINQATLRRFRRYAGKRE